MNQKFLNIIYGAAIVVLGAAVIYFITGQKSGDTNFGQPANQTKQPQISTSTSTPQTNSLQYQSTQYGFSFTLPPTWQGYLVIIDKWEGYAPTQQGDKTVETGPLISIRNPKWASQNPYQDIPIMVFTASQWQMLLQDRFHIGAAPIGPSLLGQNSRYVFALPARYNFAYPSGWQEVETILKGNPLSTFQPSP